MWVLELFTIDRSAAPSIRVLEFCVAGLCWEQSTLSFAPTVVGGLNLECRFLTIHLKSSFDRSGLSLRLWIIVHGIRIELFFSVSRYEMFAPVAGVWVGTTASVSGLWIELSIPVFGGLNALVWIKLYVPVFGFRWILVSNGLYRLNPSLIDWLDSSPFNFMTGLRYVSLQSPLDL
jgi:hypothetical protein